MGTAMIRVFAQRYERDKDFRFVVATDRVNNGYRVHVIDGKKALRSCVYRMKEHADEQLLQLEQNLFLDGWERYGKPTVMEVKKPLPGVRDGWVPDGWMEKEMIPTVVFGFRPAAVRS